MHRLRPENVHSRRGSLQSGKTYLKYIYISAWALILQLQFYLVLLDEYPGHRYVSVPDGVHERSDPAAVSVVWCVATSAGGSAKVHQSTNHWAVKKSFASNTCRRTNLSSKILTTSSQPCIALRGYREGVSTQNVLFTRAQQFFNCEVQLDRLRQKIFTLHQQQWQVVRVS